MRPYVSVDTTGIKDPIAKRAFGQINPALSDMSKALTLLLGSGGGSSQSSIIVGPSPEISIESQATTSGLSIIAQSYVAIDTDNSLLNERVLTAGTNLELTDGGAKGAVTLSLASDIIVDDVTLDNLVANSGTFNDGLTVTGSVNIAPLVDPDLHGLEIQGTLTVLGPYDTSLGGHLSVIGIADFSNTVNVSGVLAANLTLAGAGFSAAPALVFGTTNVAGSSGTAFQSNSTLAIFDGTTPPAVGTGATGVAAFAARSDHTHSMGSSSFATPALVYTTSNAGGSAATAIRSDASLAIFDATVPAALASAAATGSAAFAARRDHVHLFPSALLETTNSKKLTLTSTSTISTLTADVATLDLAVSGGGAWSLRPAVTNTLTIGAAARRPLKIFVGTSGIDLTGPFVTSSTIASSLTPSVDINFSLGSPTFRWSALYSGAIALVESGGVYNVGLSFVDGTMSADRNLIFNPTNADRTVTLTGDTTLNQDVSTAGSPTFVGLTTTGNTVLGNATSDTLRLNGGSGATAPSTSVGVAIVNYYGTSATNFLGDPVGWQSIIDSGGTTRKIPYY